jgi:hypothetical protein
MKKAKLVLVAIAVFGIAGGVMAFRAQKISEDLFCKATSSGSSACNGTLYDAGTGNNYTITTSGGFTAFCTTENTLACNVQAEYTTVAGNE